MTTRLAQQAAAKRLDAVMGTIGLAARGIPLIWRDYNEAGRGS